MAVLIGMSEEVKGKHFSVDRDKVTIGRNATNQITIEHPTVSSQHCTIVRAGHRYTLTDLGSTNGTRVNSKEIKECALSPRDLVQIGTLEFLFDAEDAGPALKPDSSAQKRVSVTNGPATTPVSFGSISPYGSRRRENASLWIFLIAAIGILALALIIVLVWKLTTG